MRLIRWRFIGCAVVVGAMLCPFIYAQDSGGSSQKTEPIDPKTTTRITVGNIAGSPGSSVVVPIYFTPAPGVDVGRLKLEIRFVSANMKYHALEPGITATLGNIDLKTSLRDEKNDQGVDTSTVTVEAATPEGSSTGITAGLLAYMTLQISEKGRPAKISLRTSADAQETGSGKEVSNLKSFDGEVEVLAPGKEPMVTCFFFSH